MLACLLWGCRQLRQEGAEDIPLCNDLPQLKEKGEIIAATLYGSTSYFQYKMQSMGYEYDLIHEFAQSQGLRLRIKVVENTTRLVEMLEAGEADVVAYPIPIHHQLKQRVIYCGREHITNQVLVQRANKGDTILTDVTQLIGRAVYVKAQTKYAERLQNLDKELGGGIHVREVAEDSISTEDLIERVSLGEIPYTVSDDKIARLNKTYYWNISIDLAISFQQCASWIVRKESPELAKAMDEWASGKTGAIRFKALTKRYFELSKQPFTAESPK